MWCSQPPFRRIRLLNKLGIIRGNRKREKDGNEGELPHKLASNVTSAFGQIGLGESHTETRNFVNILCINTYRGGHSRSCCQWQCHCHLEMAFNTASNNIYLVGTQAHTLYTHVAVFGSLGPKSKLGHKSCRSTSACGSSMNLPTIGRLAATPAYRLSGQLKATSIHSKFQADPRLAINKVA